MNLIKLWFYSCLLFVLKDTGFVFHLLNCKYNPRAFLAYGPSPITRYTYTGFTYSSVVSPLINSETFPSPLHKTRVLTTHNQSIYMFGAFVSISQSPFVSLFSFPWKEIPQTKKTEAYFLVLFCNHKETWKQIYYLELFLRKFSGHC